MGQPLSISDYLYQKGYVTEVANFARPKGAKDKKPRKRRGLGIAAAGAGTAALGYGGANVVRGLNAMKKEAEELKKAGVETKYGRGARLKAVRDVAGRDYQRAKDLAGKGKDKVGDLLNKIPGSGKAKEMAGGAKNKAGDLFNKMPGSEKVKAGAGFVGKHKGKFAGGALLAGGAAYGLKKLLSKRKKKSK